MTNERNDDEVLGRALARAIDTLEPSETPYERSRTSVRALRGGFPFAQFVGAAGVLLVITLAFGTWLTRPLTNEPVAAPATATATSGVTPAATPTAPIAATAVPASEAPSQRMWAYFTRDGLPPIGAFITAHGPTDTSDHRVLTLLSSLGSVLPSDTPAGTTNPLSQAGVYAGGSALSVGVRLVGDLATIELDAPSGWGIRDPYTRQLIQQIVYTATEEPGVRRVQLTGHSGAALKIDQLVFDKILTRDEVSGYTTFAPVGSSDFPGDARTPVVTGDLVSRDIVEGSLVRLTFVGSDRAHNAAKADLPPFTISFRPNDGGVPHNRADGAPPAYLLEIAFHVNVQGEFGAVGHVERVDRSPLRLMTSTDASYQLGLDDARPWRAYLPDPQHLIVEIGGDPRLVSDRIAVTQPIFDAIVGPSFAFSGSARVFEANVVWRVKDSAQKILASGHTTASLGSSALWGTFQTTIALPPSVTVGRLTLEVYEVSPKDGSEQGLVAIPLNR
jgi:immunoglobulin-like protein involved in spore germination